MPDADPFDPPGVTWRRPSPRLILVTSVINGAIGLVAAVAVAAAAQLTGRWWLWSVVVVVLLGTAFWVATEPRRVNAHGYAERDDDLLVRRGILRRVLVVVPYGRMQYVDVTAGPIQRLAGLATVQLHTASTGTMAEIPGVPVDEAGRLRDRLASRGESRLAGL
ncbi:PH domain-containing protein [Millisia brevis]|uniref:PH domain-containing protein n=1 Tax=Millisia brevis TaxID=264148 RepID=UPI00082CEAD3|nr:PH domain-containing protein [Millisia brevis]